MAKDYYRILGLAENAEPEVIRAVFKQLVHRNHPDKQVGEKEQANRIMAEINEAYRHLSEPLSKVKYDQRRGTSIPASDYYQVLGLRHSADAQIIDAAYTALALKYRVSPTRLADINQAYKILSDTTRKKLYDFSPAAFKGSGFSLWKVYLAYTLAFYALVAALYFLIMVL
ncbi:MAG: DnaJ domain-containing protein [Methylococcales bacterium]